MTSVTRGGLPPIPLNEPQRLHFEVALASLETALSEVEAVAKGTVAMGSLTRFEHDLPPAFAEGAAPMISTLRAEIAVLAADLDLSGSRRHASRVVRATLIAQLMRLDDGYAAKLRGYGTVQDGVAPRLDPAIDRLRSGVIQLIALLQRGDAGHA